MPISAALKQHMLATFKLAADISDADLQAEVAKRLASGELSTATFAEKQADNSGSNKIAGLVSAEVAKATAPILDAVSKLTEALGKQAGQQASGGDAAKAAEEAAQKAADEAAKKAAETKQVSVAEMEAKFAALEAKLAEGLESGNKGGAKPERIFGKAALPRVKSVAEQYSSTKSALICPTHKGDRKLANPRAGQQAKYQGKLLDTVSDLEKACVGAFIKHEVSKHWTGGDLPRGFRMTEHDQHLLAYAAHEFKWVNEDDDGDFCVKERKLDDHERKALLDEGGGSQGQYMVPEIFDQMVFTHPLLYGEVYPMVDEQVLAKGSRVRQTTLLHPELGKVAEGTPISFQDTTGFVGALDTSIYPITGAIELGEDFLEDSPVDVATAVATAYGESYQEKLDYLICLGSGSGEMTGIFNTSGALVLQTANGYEGGPLTMGDTEQLLFGLPKAVRSAWGGRNFFLGADSTYRRVRAIPRSAVDQARLFGADLESYQLHSRPFKINDAIPESKLAHVNGGAYRLYRRRGLQLRVETAGITLAKSNTRAIVARARFGGRLRTAAACAMFTDVSPNG